MLMLNRRMLLQSVGLGAAGLDLLSHARWAYAAGKDEITIGWPVDVPTWDPVERTIPDAQPIYKLVFDQPLDQAPDLSLVPKLVSKWKLADDALSMDLEFRDDVTFQDGSKMTSEDFRYTYIERVRAGLKSSVIMQEESTSARAGALASDWYYLGRVRPMEEIQKAIDNLSPSAILQHVKKHPPRDFTIVTLGPKALKLKKVFRC